MIDLRIVFVFFLILTGVLYFLYRPVEGGPIRNTIHILIGTLYLFAILGTVATFFFLLTRTDPLPFIRQGAYLLGLQQLVEFQDAIPLNLEKNLAVSNIHRVDTDSDGFNEWVVFYRFNLQNGLSPVLGVVYDNDRGDPPVIFPYNLQPPSRNYLGEGAASIEMLQVLDNVDRPQVMIWGVARRTLNIFNFEQNSEPWDFPRDAPPRYRPIGSFRGNGGISFNDSNKNVTVIDRNGFERSQLSIRSVHALNPVNNTYFDSFDSTKLAAPVISTIDFFQRPPENIFDTSFPEQIVLGFYASTCQSVNDTLCRWADVGWEPGSFLADDALTEFQNRNAAYFGLDRFSVSEISVTELAYYTQFETDPDLLVTGGGRDVVTGEEGQFNVVDVTLIANNRPLEATRYEMRLVAGQWKIVRRLERDLPPLGSPLIPRE